MLKATKTFRAGRIVLDCSGPIHHEWIRKITQDDGLKAIVHRRGFPPGEAELLPGDDSTEKSTEDLSDVLKARKGKIALIVDDLGALHYHERPLELLAEYYEALALDGEAWLRFPRSFWVFLEDQHRVSLQNYLTAKFPTLAKALRAIELDPRLLPECSGESDWVLLKKSTKVAKLRFSICPRTLGGTSNPAPRPHAPYIEFVEAA